MAPVVRTLGKSVSTTGIFLYTKHLRVMKEFELNLFSPKQIKKLQKNPNVQQVSERAITYTDDFKRRFIDDFFAGKTSRQIFKENGFDEETIGIKWNQAD